MKVATLVTFLSMVKTLDQVSSLAQCCDGMYLKDDLDEPDSEAGAAAGQDQNQRARSDGVSRLLS